MGRPAKSKELKALEGTLRKDRDRVPTKRKLENAELPQPQLDLEDEAIELFYALCTHLNEAGVLWQVDSMMLSLYCKHWAMLRAVTDELKSLDDMVQEFDNGVVQISPALTVFDKLTKTVLALGGKLGLSPADREKLASFARIEKEQEDPYDKLKMRTG
jgi:P27 family predicted phage terminase small subunit